MTVMAAVVLSSTVSHIRAQHITSAYSIWFKEFRPIGRVSEDVLARMSPEKLQAIKAGSPRERFDGQRENGDKVQILTEFNGARSVALIFATKGLIISVNPLTGSISTMGTGTPDTILPVTPQCLAFGGRQSDRDTDVILGFKTLHTAQRHGSFITESWLAPALGCQTIKRVTTRQSDGAMEIIEAYKATSDPPSDDLFKLPPNAVKKKPSEFWLEIVPLDMHKASDLLLDRRSKDDALYEEQKREREAKGL